MEKKLSELEGEIISISGRPNKLDCLFFVCPSCPGGHGVMVSWQAPSLVDSGYVWQKTGTTVEDITISPSIDCTKSRDGKPSDCGFHGWVQNGMVRW